MSKKTYTCTRRVEHDQVVHEEGDSIELEDKHAEPLLAVGAISDGSEPAAKPSRKKK